MDEQNGSDQLTVFAHRQVRYHHHHARHPRLSLPCGRNCAKNAQTKPTGGYLEGSTELDAICRPRPLICRVLLLCVGSREVSTRTPVWVSSENSPQ